MKIRASTDRLTGALTLFDLPANTLFNFVLKSRLPPSLLPSFLHEATHFWCMASSIGSGVALLELRMAHYLDDSSTSRLRRNFNALQVVNGILRPLLEGMALFSEFDTFPGDSKVWASPSYWTGRLFQPIEEDMPGDLSKGSFVEWTNTQILARISSYREGSVAQQRKSDVLLRPIMDDHDNYLLGYWSVKHIWRLAVRRTNAFIDRDLFLTYLREFVFQDWVFIDYFLDESLEVEVLGNLLRNRLHWRLKQLCTKALGQKVEAFGDLVDSEHPDVPAMLAAIDLEEGEASEGQDRFEHGLRQIVEGLGGKNENWYLGDWLTLQHRQTMMRIANESVQIEVNEHKRVLVWRKGAFQPGNPRPDGIYLAGAAPEGIAQGVYEGWIAVYFLPKDMQMIVLATTLHQTVLCIPPEAQFDEKLQTFRLAATKVIGSDSDRVGLREFTMRRLRETSADDDKEVKSVLEQIKNDYLNYAFDLVMDDVKLQELTTALNKNTLYDLLDKNGDLLTALVRMSLAPFLTEAFRATIRDELMEVGIEEEESLKRLLNIQKKVGLGLFEKLDDGTFWCRI